MKKSPKIFMDKKFLFRTVLAAVFLGMLAAAGLSQSQRYARQRLLADVTSHRQPPEGTEFIFARIRFTSTGPGRRGFGGFGGLGNLFGGWSHDYPDAEEHILQVASEATGINLTKMSYVIVDLDDEELFRYPFAYMSEVGELNMNDREVANLREYLNRGGFVMVDDFDSQYSLDWFSAQMKRVFPDRDFVRLTVEHPIFHTFYEVPTLEVESPYVYSGPATFYGYFDESGRLSMIINHNNDIGDFWEWIDQPVYPLGPSTEALRFGVNYFIYSLTH